MINERLQKYAARKLTEAGWAVARPGRRLVESTVVESPQPPVMVMFHSLMQQNRELHDRLLAVYAPTVTQTLPAMPSFQMDYVARGADTAPLTPPAGPVELPGTQVGDTE